MSRRRANANGGSAVANGSADGAVADGESSGPKRQVLQPPNPVLNALLTTAYAAAVIWTYSIFAREGAVMYLSALILVAAAGIWATRFVGKHVGIFISTKLIGGGRNPLAIPSALHKWVDQCWQFAIHVSMVIVEIYVLADEQWWQDPKQCWIPDPSEQKLKESARFLYLIQLAIYIYMGFSHRFIEQYHKDYVVMFVHHIVTILLIAGSHVMNYQRIGILVLYVHDASDITVDLLKMTNYLDLSSTHGPPIVEAVFATNLLSWVYYRNWMYPMHVINGSSFISHRVLAPTVPGQLILPDPKAWFGWRINEPFELWTFTNVLLVVLLFLHCWWLLLFLRLAVKLLFQPPHEAGREEYEGDSDQDGHTHVESTSAKIVSKVCSAPVVLFVSLTLWIGSLYVLYARDRAVHGYA